MDCIVIKRLSFMEGTAPYMTKAQFKDKYSPLIVGDQDEAYKVYKKHMAKKDDGKVSNASDTDS